ncbi:MAG: 50S ribosomal protein L25 [Planctomycetota bacterium]|nr:MAG: 50S ribosomal protein L25 [Planctomycetota bacterium]
METAQLKAEPRTGSGTRAAYRLRREGRMPAVIYGEGGETSNISVSTREMEAALRHHDRVLMLDLEGQEEKVLLHVVQYDSMGDQLLHVDFLRIGKHATVEVNVELEFIGHPKGLGHGGELVKNLTDLPIRCAPELIPETVPVQTSDLDVGDSVLVQDLNLPEGVEALVGAEDVVITIRSMTVIEEEEAPEGEEGEAAMPEVISKGKKEEEEEPA